MGRHKLPIRAKTRPDAADVIDGLFAKSAGRARRFLAATKELLDCLGELNNIAMGAQQGLPVKLAPKVTLRKCMSFNELRRLLGAIC